MNHPMNVPPSIPNAPIHPLAALVTVVLDNVIGVFEMLSPVLILVTSLVVFVLGSVSTLLIQHYIARDEWGVAAAKGLAMGILAGVPFSVTGTIFGVPLLAWAGLHEWMKPKLPPNTPGAGDSNPDLIEGEFRSLK